MRVAIAAVAVGGVIGALARYGLTLAFPVGEGRFPWVTWIVNVSGCLLIGILLAWLAARPAPAWVRPLLGTGVLGGFTTFSAYSVDTLRLLDSGRPLLALGYVFATLIGALAAVFAGARLTRKLLAS